jgi:hypothetical protein
VLVANVFSRIKAGSLHVTSFMNKPERFAKKFFVIPVFMLTLVFGLVVAALGVPTVGAAEPKPGQDRQLNFTLVGEVVRIIGHEYPPLYTPYVRYLVRFIRHMADNEI